MCGTRRVWWQEIRQVRTAYGRLFVPLIHGINRLTELCTAGLIDIIYTQPKPLCFRWSTKFMIFSWPRFERI
jgi:hypothetical protein